MEKKPPVLPSNDVIFNQKLFLSLKLYDVLLLKSLQRVTLNGEREKKIMILNEKVHTSAFIKNKIYLLNLNLVNLLGYVHY